MRPLSSKNLWIVAAVSLVLGLLFNYFFFDKQMGISFLLYICALLGVLFGLLFYLKIPFNRQTLWYIIPILFFSGMASVRSSYILLFWNLVMTLALLIIFTNHQVGKNAKNYILFDYIKTAVVIPLKILTRLLNVLVRLFSIKRKSAESQRSSQVTKGILITLPIFIFFALLFSSADLVFNHLVSNIFSFDFNFNINPDLVSQFFWMIIFACIWLGSLVYILEDSSPTSAGPAPLNEPKRTLGNIEVGILLGSLNFLFLVFVIIQIKYLFAGHDAITNFGYTYAQYAHKGFVELVLVAVMTFLLIFGAEKYSARRDRGHTPLFKLMSVLMALLVLTIIVSAFMRLLIYEQAYGFTVLRILAQGFIIWLAAIFLWLLYKIISRLAEREFAFGMFLSVIAFFAIFNLLNPDAFIARKNINRFAADNKLDTDYLSTLSADAVPEIARLLEFRGLTNTEGDGLPETAALILVDQKTRLDGSKKLWQSYNGSRDRAAELINQKWETIKALSNKTTSP